MAAQLQAGGARAGAAGSAPASGGVLAAAAAAGGGKAVGAAGRAAAASAPGWKVLQEGFSGLGGAAGGGKKMRDFDRKVTGSDDEDARHVDNAKLLDGAGTDSEDGDGGEGW